MSYMAIWSLLVGIGTGEIHYSYCSILEN